MVAAARLDWGMKFNEKLRTLMRKQRLSQEDVADVLAVSQNLVSRWCRAKNTPDIYQGLALARFLGVPLDYLVDEAIDDPSEVSLSEGDRIILQIAAKMGRERAVDKLTEDLDEFRPKAPFLGVATTDLNPPGKRSAEPKRDNDRPEPAGKPRRV